MKARAGVGATASCALRRCGCLLLGASLGCGSSEASRFYQLQPALAARTAQAEPSPGSAALVGIGPIHVPDYLDRPQIVTAERNAVDVADFERWAGALEAEIGRVLAQDLAALLPPDRFFVTPWPSRAAPVAYRLEVLVQNFEGSLQGPVWLRAQWFVYGPQRQLLLREASTIQQRVPAGGYPELVGAMSEALQALSLRMAERLTQLAARAQP